MKKKILYLIGIFLLFLLSTSCGINNQAVDPGLENDADRTFHAHDHQKGEGFGLWNQQRDRRNPIANMVTRDDRPGRGMNGIADKHPYSMNRRVPKFEGTRSGNEAGTQRGFSNIHHQEDGNLVEQLTLELLGMATVRDARVIKYHDHLLVAIDSEATDTTKHKEEISSYVNNRFPNKEIIVVTDRQAVDRIRLLDDGYRSGRRGEDYGVELREFFNDANREVEQSFR